MYKFDTTVLTGTRTPDTAALLVHLAVTVDQHTLPAVAVKTENKHQGS